MIRSLSNRIFSPCEEPRRGADRVAGRREGELARELRTELDPAEAQGSAYRGVVQRNPADERLGKKKAPGREMS